MMGKPSNVYEFGDFRLDTAERLLLRGDDAIPLTPKVFDTLQALVEQPGRLLRKDDLLKLIWSDAIVEEANLARNIWVLRKALGDTDKGAYIETIPKIGYRFVAPVRELPPTNGAAPTAGTVPPAEGGLVETPARPQRKGSSRVVLTVLVITAVVLTLFGAARPWWRPSIIPDPAAGIRYLTDGQYDDAAASWGSDGRVFFSRFVKDDRVETWTMKPDGTDQRRANDRIPGLLAGRWSPDGKRVIFVKEDGGQTTYMAEADGSNETVLPFSPGNLDWSPDGSRVVYQAKDVSGAQNLFLYTFTTTTNINLTPGIGSADPSFSPDGSHIAFTSWRDGNSEIYVMRNDGSGVRRITNHPAFDNYPVFSPDGTQIAFQSNREDEHVEIYLQNLNDDSPPRRLTRSRNLTGFAPGCWSRDGTRMLVYTNGNGHGQIATIDVDPFPARLLLADDRADLGGPRVSADGRRVLYEARLADRSLELRVTDLETRRTKLLFRTGPDYPLEFHLEPAWSPDESLVAFTAREGSNTEVFVMKADGSGLRNVTNNPLIDSSPVFVPPNNDIVFARDSYGQAHLYRMDTAGRSQRRLTDRSGYEMNPAISPDGEHLAFAGDRESHGLDILTLDLNHPGTETKVAVRPSHDVSPAFSPDGKRLVFLSTGDGNPELYVVNADGSGLFRVTHTSSAESAPRFSPDGKHIVFSSNRSGRFAIYQVELPQ